MNKYSVLAGMLTVDESQFERALAAMREQEGCNVSFEVFGAFDEREAHRRLYASLSRSRRRFDVRCKVDADMVIIHPRLFAVAARTFECFPQLDTIMVPLHDFYTDGEINGLLMWSPRVKWTSSADWIFSDAATNTSRNLLTLKSLTAPVALHAPDPAPEQAARFGSHRALKGLAKGPRAKNWRHLRHVIAANKSERDPRRSIALAAALDAATGPLLDDHLSAATSGPAIDIDRIIAISQSESLVPRINALLGDERTLADACEARGPTIRAFLTKPTPRPLRTEVQKVFAKVQEPMNRLRGQTFDKVAAQRLFISLLD